MGGMVFPAPSTTAHLRPLLFQLWRREHGSAIEGLHTLCVTPPVEKFVGMRIVAYQNLVRENVEARPLVNIVLLLLPGLRPEVATPGDHVVDRARQNGMVRIEDID